MSKSNRKPANNQVSEMDNTGETNQEFLNRAEEAGVDMEPVTETAKIVAEETAEALIAKHGNKSNAIRAMSAAGQTRSQIAKALGIRYQHVNNVLNQVLKREIKKERDQKNGNGAEATEVTAKTEE